MIATTNGERSPTIRLTAQQRRDEIVDAAMHEFTQGGFDATPAAVIALQAGVSQPYLFALSGTKRNLFIAGVKQGSEQMWSLIPRAAGGDGEADDALNGVRTALLSPLQRRALLLLQLHAFAACEDLDIPAVARAAYRETGRVPASTSRAPDRLLRSLPAEQAMPSAAAALDLPEAWS